MSFELMGLRYSVLSRLNAPILMRTDTTSAEV
jgi:hypothetical protein